MTQPGLDKLNSRLDLSALDGHVILMTGGTGFVGQAMWRAFRESDAHARLFISTREIAAGYGDTLDERVRLISRASIYVPQGVTDIVHLEPDSDSRITEWIAQTAALTSARVLYASSGAALMGVGRYADSKRTAERLLIAQSFSHKFSVIIARLWTFVGPHLPLEPYAVGNFIRDGLAGGPIVVRGSGKAVRSYMYSSDLAEWMWSALIRGRSSQVYNVGSDEAVTIGDLATEVAGKFGCGVVVENDPDVPNTRYVPDAGNTRRELGLSIKVSRSEAIDKTITWHRERRGNVGAISSVPDEAE